MKINPVLNTLVWSQIFFANLISPAFARTLAKDEVAKHAIKSDCWVIIEQEVYDISNYIDRHPTESKILTDMCGKNATKGWQSKPGSKRPHSVRAKKILHTMRIGEIIGAS